MTEWSLLRKKRASHYVCCAAKGEKQAFVRPAKGWIVTLTNGERELDVFIESGSRCITCLKTGMAIQHWGKEVKSMKDMINRACEWPRLFDTYLSFLKPSLRYPDGKFFSEVERFNQLVADYEKGV